MAIQKLSQVSGKTVSAVSAGILELRSPIAGTLQKVTVFVRAAVSATLTFDVNKGTVAGNLATIFASPSNRPSITSGNYSDEVSGLSVAVAVGDILSIDADVVGENFTLATVIFEIEDGTDYADLTGAIFTGAVEVPAEAYGSDWNGSLEVPTKNDLYDKIETISNGGQTGAVFNADSPPVSPNAEDDEFLSPTFTLDPKWTKAAVGTVTEDSVNERIQSTYFIRLAPGGGLYLTQPFAPGSADFSLTLAGYLIPTQNYHSILMTVKDSANATNSGTPPNNYIQYYLGYVDAPKVAVNTRVSGTTNPAVYGATVSDINYSKSYLHLQRIGGNFEGYYSNNGTSWKSLFAGYSQSFTISHIEITFETYGAAAKMQGGFDWIRRDWLFL